MFNIFLSIIFLSLCRLRVISAAIYFFIFLGIIYFAVVTNFRFHLVQLLEKCTLLIKCWIQLVSHSAVLIEFSLFCQSTLIIDILLMTTKHNYIIIFPNVTTSKMHLLLYFYCEIMVQVYFICVLINMTWNLSEPWNDLTPVEIILAVTSLAFTHARQ